MCLAYLEAAMEEMLAPAEHNLSNSEIEDPSEMSRPNEFKLVSLRTVVYS